MKKSLFLFANLFAILPLFISCSRVPAGVFSIADGSEAAARAVNSNAGIREQRDLKRLQQIDKSIQASLARLDAALDPNNTDPAHLEKLIAGDVMDPALASNRINRQQALVEQKFDEKNQALLDNTLSGKLDNIEETNNLDPHNLPRAQRLQLQIDEKIDQKVLDVLDSEQAEEDKPESSESENTSAPETSTDSVSDDAQESSDTQPSL